MNCPPVLLHRLTLLCAMAGVFSGSSYSLSAQGIPEPTLIFYGLIRNTADNNLSLHQGSLRWTNRMVLNGRTVAVTAALGNFAGFSYVLEVKAETLISGPVSSNVLQLTGTTNVFEWLPVVYDSGILRTQLTFVIPAQASFSASSRQRGRIERVDFTVGILCHDSDGNGLCDDWEIIHCGAPGACGAHNQDFDGDGLTNLQEYRVGSDPADPNSGLLFVHSEALPTGGMRVEWQSAEGRSYGLYRSTNLLSLITANLPVSPDVKLIATNLFATPPSNVFDDTNTVPPGPYFYRLRLE